MKKIYLLCLPVLGLLALAYTGSPAQRPYQKRKEPPLAMENGKLFEKDGKRYLWGGKDESWHFDITSFRLDPTRLHHGKGREYFHALIQPEFIAAREADKWLTDDRRVLAVKIGGQVKVYPIDLLIRHEVVNDVVGGKPILAAYCILADLGAVYDRRLFDRTFTFGVSGYTYYDPEYWDGKDAFIIWDRETESLWWPVTGKAVSGPLIDQQIRLLEQELWSQTTWGEIKTLYPMAMVLAPGQTLIPPSDWPKYDPDSLRTEYQEKNSANSISPR